MARWIERWRGVWGRGAFPAEFWFILDPPGRGWIQNTARHAEHLQLAPDMQVLELGSGTGFWSRAVAAKLQSGTLHLFDLQSKFLKRARRRIEREGHRNVTYCAGDGRNLAYRTGSFDRAFLVTVLGEVPSQDQCLGELYRVLKPGGLVAITENRGDPDYVPREQLKSLAAEAGFELTGIFGGIWAYTALFTKPASDQTTP